jgi:hypothetical protein
LLDLRIKNPSSLNLFIIFKAQYFTFLNEVSSKSSIAVSEPEGKLPSESPYMYIAKIEVSDLDAMVNFLGTDEGKKFVQSWSIYLDPKSIFTMGHDI